MIEPGTYQTSDEVAYWERLTGFRGDHEKLIDHGRCCDEDVITVVIDSSDVGFNSINYSLEDDLTWEIID